MSDSEFILAQHLSASLFVAVQHIPAILICEICLASYSRSLVIIPWPQSLAHCELCLCLLYFCYSYLRSKKKIRVTGSIYLLFSLSFIPC